MRLWIRRARLTIGTMQFTEELRFAFRIRKTLKPEPNQAEVRVWNLGPNALRLLSENEVLPVQIEAGYDEGLSTVFLGQLRSGETQHVKEENISTLYCGDSERGLRTARISKSFAIGAPPATILKEIARSLGVGNGNVDQAVLRIKTAGIGKAFSSGTVCFGSASDEMTRVCRSFGLSWSVQDGKLQILEINKALEQTAIEVATIPENTGVLDAISVDNKGKLTARLLMIPDVLPGRKIVVRGQHHSGQYVIQQTDILGDTDDAGDWCIDVEGKRY